MRLFLSSYRFGEYSEVLRAMVDENTEVGVIANAKDYKNLQERTESVQGLFADLIGLGLTPHEIDLRPFFGQPDLLQLELQKYGLVWLAGGNTFILRRALKASGGDKLIAAMVRDGTLAYGGESAGAIMATPSLKGAEFSDDPDIIPEGYSDEDVWDGLSLVPYSIVPHYESGLEGVDRMLQVLDEEDVAYKTLTDSQVIVVGDDEEALLL